MKKILLFVLPCGMFWNCFTFAVAAKHSRSISQQRDHLSFLQESAREIQQISRSESELKVIYHVAVYTSKDTKDRDIKEKTICFSLKSLSYVDTYYQRTESSQTCGQSDLLNFQNLKVEEIPELKNGMWIPDLGVVLYSKKGFDKFTIPFPAPYQLSSGYYYPRIDYLKYFKGREVVSATLFQGNGLNRYLRLQLETKEEIYLYGGGSGFQIFLNHLEKPVKKIPDNIKIAKEEELEIRKFIIPKEEKLIAVQYEYPDTSGIFRTESKVFKITGAVQDLRSGILFISLPYRLNTKEDEKGIWSLYPALYPFSIVLDIATSPLQLLSMLAFGYDGHFYLWGCILARKCAGPMG
ncbi:hypothetical protein EHQ52_03900 [Leptospira koniambonensis]|uniref:Lipoprotein n=1 Tax=Leptospira koniambonensis TaxID=2484950 RepID=A0A4V3JNW2_9LEPT|nr:hypothetical protein [Leptospira koniambonensis]TGL37023.1 hypothetical protein EHQ52_03900 [Leptospira koniambonensis]